jgi:hypothetical protein
VTYKIDSKVEFAAGEGRAVPVQRFFVTVLSGDFLLFCASRANMLGETMIVEMRTYKTKPGRRTEFLEIFRTRSVPAHTEIGMKISGPFLSVEDPDTFFFMRGFPDLPSRDPMKEKFYEGKLWKDELENVLMPMLEKYEVVVVEDPDRLIHWPLAAGPADRPR